MIKAPIFQKRLPVFCAQDQLTNLQTSFTDSSLSYKSDKFRDVADKKRGNAGKHLLSM